MHRHLRCISLSLSLCRESSSALNGARNDLLAGRRRALERGFRAAWRRPTTTAPLACAHVANSLGCSPDTPRGTPEEAPSRAPTRAGYVGPRRRGSVPNLGPRRPLLFAVSGKQVRISSRPIVPLQRAGRDETLGSCAGSVPNLGPRRPLLYAVSIERVLSGPALCLSFGAVGRGGR
jgi:hypothetical protein